MWSIGQIADRDGVSKQAVSKQVKRYIERGELQHERDANNRVTAVNFVQYDKLRGRFGDSAKQRVVREPDAPSDGSLDQARLLKARADAEMARLNIAERRGEVIRKDLMAEAIVRVGEDIRRLLTLQNDADDLAAAMARGGPREMRAHLKAMEFRICTAIADSLSAIAIAAPLTDQPLQQETPQPA